MHPVWDSVRGKDDGWKGTGLSLACTRKTTTMAKTSRPLLACSPVPPTGKLVSSTASEAGRLTAREGAWQQGVDVRTERQGGTSTHHNEVGVAKHGAALAHQHVGVACLRNVGGTSHSCLVGRIGVLGALCMHVPAKRGTPHLLRCPPTCRAALVRRVAHHAGCAELALLDLDHLAATRGQGDKHQCMLDNSCRSA